MYGIFLNSIFEVVRKRVGEDRWMAVRSKAGINTLRPLEPLSINSESWLPSLIEAACLETGIHSDELLEECGHHFLSFVERYLAATGSPLQLSTLGRTLRHFINGIDNLHEYFRSTFPAMRAPSFHCESEPGGEIMLLHYRSSRLGFVPYVIGIITAVARKYYHTEITVDILSKEVTCPQEVTSPEVGSSSCVLDLSLTECEQSYEKSRKDAYDESLSNHVTEIATIGDVQDQKIEREQLRTVMAGCPQQRAVDTDIIATLEKDDEMGREFERKKSVDDHVTEMPCHYASASSVDVTGDRCLKDADSCFSRQADGSAGSPAGGVHGSNGRIASFCSARVLATTSGDSFMTEVVLRLKLNKKAAVDNNESYVEPEELEEEDEALTPVPDSLSAVNSQLFLDAFPFHVLFDRDTIVTSVGSGLEAVMASSVVGERVDKVFQLKRPLIRFTWQNVTQMQ